MGIGDVVVGDMVILLCLHRQRDQNHRIVHNAPKTRYNRSCLILGVFILLPQQSRLYAKFEPFPAVIVPYMHIGHTDRQRQTTHRPQNSDEMKRSRDLIISLLECVTRSYDCMMGSDDCMSYDVKGQNFQVLGMGLYPRKIFVPFHFPS